MWLLDWEAPIDNTQATETIDLNDAIYPMGLIDPIDNNWIY